MRLFLSCLSALIVAGAVSCGTDPAENYTAQALTGASVTTSPLYHDFSAVTQLGHTLNQGFTITNTDSVSFTVTGVSMRTTLGDEGTYSIYSETCAEVTLAPTDTCSVVVEFAPYVENQESGGLVLETDAGTWDAGYAIGDNWVMGYGGPRVAAVLAGDGSGYVLSDGGGNPDIACGSGGGTDCAGIFAQTADLYMYAYPNECSTFTGWDVDGCEGDDPVCDMPLSLELNTTTTATATFSAIDSCYCNPCGLGCDPCGCHPESCE